MGDCDVLIIGAGPVGVTLALELAHQKVSFRIIDKAVERSDKSRAMVVQPRTLELFNRHGQAQSLASRGRVNRGASVVVSNKEAFKISLVGIGADDTEFPYPHGISQAETERFLDECLAGYGTKVERPVTAKSILQDDNGVTTVLEHAEGNEERVRAKYVVGCDGAHSFVRHAAPNLRFEGAPYAHDFLLCDAHIRDTTLPMDRFSLLLGNGAGIFFPMNDGRVRFVTSGENDEEPTLGLFQSYLEKFAPPGHGTLYDPVWITRFRLHHRGVSAYRDGRLFVAGDAAHIHSPVGGQGMNTGIQDAVNLGWKLAFALQNRTTDPEALLDSYDAERRPIGERLLSTTDQAFYAIFSSSWLFLTVRNFFFAWVLPYLVPRMLQGARRQRWYKFLTEFGVTYRKGPIVGAATGFTGPVGKGDRLPDGKADAARGGCRTVTVQSLCSGRNHTLLVFAGSETKAVSTAGLAAATEKVAAAMKDTLETRYIFQGGNVPADGDLPEGSYVDSEDKIHAQYGFAKPGYVLVRPDLYVAHVGPLDQVDEVVEFAKKL